MDADQPGPSSRRAELAAALDAMQARITGACARAGRDREQVTLIAVTKRFPASDARLLLELGVPDLGESRDQEARAKAAELPEARWHFVGQLQTNKARSVARYASCVHSVDRAELVLALGEGVRRADRGRLDVFLQISLDGDPDRGGVVPAEVEPLADAIAGTEQLHLLGVMAVAPMDADAEEAFARLAQVSQQLLATHPGATAISAGMSSDLESAIAHGATHVRVGTALLGPRPLPVG